MTVFSESPPWVTLVTAAAKKRDDHSTLALRYANFD
jgi:hypothetical protein